MIIRKYLEKDYASVAAICKKTAKKGYQTNVACWLFLDYYLESEPEHAFVAEVDGKVIGYGVCSLNDKLYFKEMKEKWIPKIASYAIYLGLFSRLSLWFNLYITKTYQCSFHMNISKDYQGKGIGKKLLDAMILHIRQYQMNFLYCITENKETMGYGFYRHYGFRLVKSFMGAKVLVYKIN